MKTYTKEHVYNGYRFLIEVTLDAIVERHPNGRRQHYVKIQETNLLFHGKEYTVSENLANSITETIKSAENWVESRKGNHKTEDDILMESLGFAR
jgi:hypothetical protein